MDWVTDRHWFWFAVAFYGVCTLYSVFLWRRGFREDNRIIYILLLAAAGLHSIAMIKRGVSFSRCPVNDLFGATMFLGWVTAISYLVVGVWRKLRFLGVFVSPVLLAAGVFGLMPGLDATPVTNPELRNFASAHAAVVLLAYGAFGLSAAAALMYLSQQHSLKFDKLRAVTSLLPPIQRLESVIWRTLMAGFGLLTVGLVIGTIGLKQTQGVFLALDAKVIWSLVVWCFYLGLLLVHRVNRQTGRRFAWSALGSFCFILLTFWGFNLLSRIHHP